MSTAKGSGEDLRSWAKKQLGFDDDTPDSSIPAVYMSELRKHATWYPLDMNFSIVLQEGSGFGIVTCLESGCDSAVVRLGKRPSDRDSGIRDGLGSLSAYRVHITRCLAHVASRDARVKAGKATQVGPSSTFSSSTSHHLRRNLPPKMEPQDSSLSLTRRSASASVAKSDSRERLLLDSQPTSTVASVPSKRPSSPLLKTSSPLIKVKDEEPELIDLSLFDARPVKKVKTEPDSLPSLPSTPTKKPLSQANRASPRGMFHTLPTPQSTADIRARIGDLQSNIADINGQIARVRRKSIPSRAELLRVAAWERDRADMEAEKARLSAKILGVSRNGSWASVKEEHNPYANAFNMPTTPVKKDFDEDGRVNYLLDPSSPFRGDAHLSQTPVASGSNVRLPPSSPSAPPTSPFRSSSPFTDSDEAKPLAFTPAEVKPTIVLAQSTAGQETVGVAAGKAKAPDIQPVASSSKEQRLFPVPAPQDHQVEDEVQQYVNGQLPNLDDDDEVYDDDGNWFGRGRDTFEGPVANADDIDKFLIAAGNAEQFDGNAKVDDALVKLGLPGLYQPLPGMEIALMPHQAIGVAWMLDRERGPHKGGCLSDEMGLGKTVQMLATLVSNQSRDSLKKSTLIVAPLALLDQWHMEIEMKTNCDLKCLIYHGSTKVKRRVDLQKYDIVLTTFHTLAMEWPDPEEQVKKARKNKKGGNKVDYWDGESSSSEEDKKKKKVAKKRGLGILLQMDWYRVILDEAQSIRNKKTRISRAVTKLETVYRWALTGTPIINSLSDAYAIIRFLRIRPWYDWVEFNNQVAKPERKQPSLAATRLQAIFTSMLLRRKKDTMLDGKRLIELPPKEVHLTKLEFTAEERDVYRIVETQSQATFNRFLQAGTVLKNYTQVLVLLLRLRQICSHPSLIQESGNAFILPVDESDEGVSYEAREELERARKQVSSEFVARMKYKLRDVALKRMAAEQESADATVEDEECPICFDIFTAAIVTPCTHIFCRECIGNVLAVPRVDDVNDQQKYKANEHPCPTCRSPICKEKLYARSAFMPTDEDLKALSEAQASGSNAPGQRSYTRLDSDIEMLDDEAVKPIDVKGKGRARRFVARKRLLRKTYDSEDDSEHEDADDDLSDFIVQSDEDEEEKEERMKLKKRLGKTKARPIVLDSDDDEVVFGKKKHVQDLPKEQIKLMPKFLPSTKMKHMMELLCDWANKNPNEKTIVISQWTQCLTLVSDYLTERGIVHVKYQGNMARNKRDQAVRVFMGKDSATVMLMSLKCGGVGLNLTRANRVISLDLAWSSAVESQAFDRVHRLGQMREVFVHRLVIENTVEDRVLMLQERKQALADGSLGEGAGKKLGRLSVKELANLFGLDHRGRVLN